VAPSRLDPAVLDVTDADPAVSSSEARTRRRIPTAVLRRRYRELTLGPGFSLPRRLLVTFGGTTAAIALCVSQLRGVQLRELWVVPCTLLYGTLAEHLAHRWAMHREVPRLERIFLEHRVHHRHFTHAAMHAEDAADFQMVLSSTDRKSTRLNSSHNPASRMPSSA
jgi:hypothetical protein